jgi:2-C-methyl-D-erythritol 4-phosphate cytidylyltransferase
MTLAASILAGGTGQRMGTGLPKQFLELLGEPLIVRTLRTFLKSGHFALIAVAIHPDWINALEELLAKTWPGHPVDLVPGGPSRQASSHHVLEHFARKDPPPGGVLIHDAARCLLSTQLLDRCVAALRHSTAFTCAIETTDTVAIVQNQRIRQVPLRSSLRRIQTPQGFEFRTILAAHRQAANNGITDVSDDAQLILNLDEPVDIVPGETFNLKISHPQDLVQAEHLLKSVHGEDGR